MHAAKASPTRRLLLKRALLILALCAPWLTGCLPATRPVIKIGLVAPFEGRYRDVGYEVVYAVRLAVREANAQGGVAGHAIELVTLDDGGDPALAILQAEKLTTDPQVVGAIGHWLESTTLSATQIYADNHLPLLATTAAPDLPEGVFRLWITEAALEAALPEAAHCPAPCDSLEDLDWLLRRAPRNRPVAGPPLWGQPQFARLAGDAADRAHFIAPAPLPGDSADPSFAARYRAISNGVEPRANAVLAYDAARVLFTAISGSAGTLAKPTRAGVLSALAHVDHDGLSGHITFNSDRDWAEARGWVYRWEAGQIVKP